ncbi:hypothetical protein [Pectobacterium phage Wc4-1]|uniref:Uncharacterized protein n=2 Tax=Arnovirus TaxID=3425109 RepID=A0A5P8D5Y5_9CAUD|nr:hypothetical protein Arno162_117 [Pectobacterium phage Arno162]QFP93832.1 hypothetical protein [Pectobacterium phage Wc4]QFP93977.1 hypothetical protein [Pectobacterium phage Wc4-1]
MTTTVVKLKDGSTKFQNKDTPVLRFALKDVWFYFLTTAPRPNKGKTFNAAFPAKDSSYSVQVLVTDEDVLDEIEKSKTKDGYTKVTRAVVKAEDFEEQFKCKPPFEAKKYYFLKLNRHAGYADGATFTGAHYIPIVEVKDGKKIEHARSCVKAAKSDKHEEKKVYDAIKTEPMIGNGSKGHVILVGSWYEFEKDVNQKPMQESFVMTDLIEYVSTANGEREVSDDDMDALGLGGLETVKAAPRDAAEEIDRASEKPKPVDDGEPLDDPDADGDGEEGFQTE